MERDNAGLDKALAGIAELKERGRKISLDDKGNWSNQSLPWARQVQDMIVLGESSVSEASTDSLDYVVSGAQMLTISIK